MIVPDKIDLNFLKSFEKIIRKFVNKYDFIITTGGGSVGRNYINALSCDVMVACGMGAGTSSEVSHAIQANKPIVLLGADDETKRFFQKLGGKLINISSSPKEAINLIINLVGDKK